MYAQNAVVILVFALKYVVAPAAVHQVEIHVVVAAAVVVVILAA